MYNTPRTNWLSTSNGTEIPAGLNTVEGDTEHFYDSGKTFRFAGSQRYDTTDGVADYLMYKVLTVPAGHGVSLKRCRVFAFVPSADDLSVLWTIAFRRNTPSIATTLSLGAGRYKDLSAGDFGSFDLSVLDNTGASPVRYICYLQAAFFPAGSVFQASAELSIECVPLP
jgi:hypothetical protein